MHKHKDVILFSFKKGGKRWELIKHFEPFLREVSSLEGVVGVDIGELILKGSSQEEIAYKIKFYDQANSCLRIEGLYWGGKQVFKLKLELAQLGRVIEYLGEKYDAGFREED